MYPDDYVGFRYDDPGAQRVLITRESATRALEDGRAARKNPTTPTVDDAGQRLIADRNPYRGKSMVLAGLWDMAYEGRENPEGQAR